MSTLINVILSGGVGSRLWPLSRKSKPKQYLPIFGNKSLFRHTLERNQPLVNKVVMVGSVHNKDMAIAALNGHEHTFIAESVPRNTAAAIAFAALACAPSDVLIVTPSDHMIEENNRYNEAIQKGIEYAKDGFISTFGIKPSRPETGYGYIECEGNDVLSFREKPNEDTARDFLKRGNFLWNSGIFCFKAEVYLNELLRFEPKLYHAAKLAFGASVDGVVDLELSKKIPSKSIDYAVMERSELIKVVPANFHWSDMGAFDSLYDYLKSKGTAVDSDGNMVIGDDRPVSFLGMRDTILVNTEDVVLVLNKHVAQDVKLVYEELEKQDSPYI